MFNRKSLVVLMLLVSGVLALFAFFTPHVGEIIVEEEQDLFLEEDQDIDIRVHVDDVGHFIGETFSINVVVQYRSRVIEVNPKSIERISFTPVDVIEIIANNENLNDGVSEYSYEFRARGIDVVPGNSYRVQPFTLEYTTLSTGETQEAVVEPNLILSFGTYYGESIDGASLRPLFGAVANQSIFKSIVFGLSAFVMLVLLIGVFISNKDNHEEQTEDVEDKNHELLAAFEELAFYGNDEWLRQKSSRKRMHELEALSLKIARLTDDILPQDFWNLLALEENKELLYILESGYRKIPPNFEDVRNAKAGIEELFSSEEEDTENIIQNTWNRLRSKRGR
ncbi:MAG: hypothetical protein R3346_02945 [Candidatus Spechtbacterales bacterium]|nr:hypothetical protein [Candidatus Spechtbacterales bacterium]